MRKILGLALCVLLATAFAGGALAEETPGSFTQMISTGAPLAAGTAPTKMATLDVFTDDLLFNGLTLEDFNASPVGPAGVLACSNPVDSSGGGACFAPGDIVAGLSYSASTVTGAVVSIGAGLLPNITSPAIAADFFADSNIIEFSAGGVFAVGFDVFVSGPDSLVDIAIEDEDGLPIGASSVTAGVDGAFWGVTSDVAIGKVTVATAGGLGEIIDNVSFGSICPCVFEDELFGDFVTGAVSVLTVLECRDDADNTGILVTRTDGTVAGAASGVKGGRPNSCGTQVGSSRDFIEITPEEDASCRALLRAACDSLP